LDFLELTFRVPFQAVSAAGGASKKLSIQLVTEIKLTDRESGETEIIRCHPNYRSEGCWYDHVELYYGEDVGYYPARVAIFFQWPVEIPVALSGCSIDPGELVAVLQEDNFRTPTQDRDPSLLFSHYNLKHQWEGQGQCRRRVATFKMHPAASINRRIFAVNPDPSDGGPFWRQENLFEIIWVEERKIGWPNAFLESFLLWGGRK
jgi:hypothetical protein